MKKIILSIILVLSILFLNSCSNTKVKKEPTTENSMFVIVEQTNTWKVVYHKETKVMYVVSSGTYNSGTFTLLVDEEGKPLLWEE